MRARAPVCAAVTLLLAACSGPAGIDAACDTLLEGYESLERMETLGDWRDAAVLLRDAAGQLPAGHDDVAAALETVADRAEVMIEIVRAYPDSQDLSELDPGDQARVLEAFSAIEPADERISRFVQDSCQ